MHLWSYLSGYSRWREHLPDRTVLTGTFSSQSHWPWSGALIWPLRMGVPCSTSQMLAPYSLILLEMLALLSTYTCYVLQALERCGGISGGISLVKWALLGFQSWPRPRINDTGAENQIQGKGLKEERYLFVLGGESCLPGDAGQLKTTLGQELGGTLIIPEPRSQVYSTQLAWAEQL